MRPNSQVRLLAMIEVPMRKDDRIRCFQSFGHPAKKTRVKPQQRKPSNICNLIKYNQFQVEASTSISRH